MVARGQVTVVADLSSHKYELISSCFQFFRIFTLYPVFLNPIVTMDTGIRLGSELGPIDTWPSQPESKVVTEQWIRKCGLGLGSRWVTRAKRSSPRGFAWCAESALKGAAGENVKTCDVNSNNMQRSRYMVPRGNSAPRSSLTSPGDFYMSPQSSGSLSAEQLQGLEELRITTVLELLDGQPLLGLRKHRRGTGCQCNQDMRHYSFVPYGFARWCEPFFDG